ncbi:MAG TPA: alpha/beta fold hydrolase [Flavobacteriales bacterium]|nr:alpha/beta fold hydrolase [Flavobacteriales bacterium]HRO40127.1 alpha/beta fold hydrolase [Flavobacteriales bacterium]HRP82149.1 alpha/beta fold hydrolase [Flavobacteriales bacterium]HRQ85039.1 alpha/beta fold hydrolase [Flavobacteriales bacterium]
MDLHYGEAGTGLPLVLLHGFPLDHTLWFPQLESLAGVARVIAPDLRGFGRSPEASATTAMEVHAQDVKQLLDRIGITRAVVGGLSMGGYVALAFAEMYPEMLQGLILCNTRAVADGEAARRRREITALKALDGGVPELSRNMVGQLISIHSAKAQPGLGRLVEAMLIRQSASAWAASSRGMAIRPDRTPLLAKLQVPALVITGSRDTLILPAESEAMAAKLPHAELVVIPDVGHLSNLEAPSAFNAAVRKFLHCVVRTGVQ